MKIYRELTLEGTDENLMKFVDAWSPGETVWSRDSDQPVIQKVLGTDHFSAKFVKAVSDVSSVTLLLWGEAGSGRLSVTHIVPHNLNGLTMDEYNAILFEFYEAFVKNEAPVYHLTVTIGADEEFINDVVSNESAAAFRSFCVNANRTILHPFDQQRWRQFIIRTFNEDKVLDNEQVAGFLVDEKWSVGDASELASKYEFAIRMLEEYVDAASWL